MDQRALRTRQLLDQAFVEWLHRRSYDSIRVSDITKKAGVGRATFYGHYLSKDDLLRSQFARIVAPLLTVNPLNATRLFQHLHSAPRIYKSLMGNAGRSVIQSCFETHLSQSLPIKNDAIPRPMVVRWLAASLVSVIDSWIDAGMLQSPEETQRMFSQLTKS